MTKYKVEPLPITSLLLDSQNPRLSDKQANQQKAALALASRQGVAQVIRLADDILKEGLDPLNLSAVIPAKGRRSLRYRVIEGNRRLLALRVLDAPALISPLMTTAQSNRLNRLADQFAADPIDSVLCVVFDSEDDARHWITLRHTGQNDGVGLVEWGAEEKDRYEARQGQRRPAGQIMEFAEKHGLISQEARDSDRKILTNIERLAGNPYARKKLGVDVKLGQVTALYPLDELAKSLGRMVQELKTNVSVRGLYDTDDRKAFVDGFPPESLPDPDQLLDTPIPLDQLTGQKVRPKEPKGKNGGSKSSSKEGSQEGTKGKADGKDKGKAEVRLHVIPPSCELHIPNVRINKVYGELQKLYASTYLNACSVLLRVFLEMSIDEYIEQNSVTVSNANPSLASKMKDISGHMHADGAMSKQLRKAVDKFADGQTNSALGVPTFNLYVHNQHFFPRAKDVYEAWDQLESFFKHLWPDPIDDADGVR